VLIVRDDAMRLARTADRQLLFHPRVRGDVIGERLEHERLALLGDFGSSSCAMI
jgi:hypothetical protein